MFYSDRPLLKMVLYWVKIKGFLEDENKTESWEWWNKFF